MPAKFETDPEGVINLAFSIKINQKKMKKLEREYTTMKTKEKEDEIELRVRSLGCPRFCKKFKIQKVTPPEILNGVKWFPKIPKT